MEEDRTCAKERLNIATITFGQKLRVRSKDAALPTRPFQEGAGLRFFRVFQAARCGCVVSSAIGNPGCRHARRLRRLTDVIDCFRPSCAVSWRPTAPDKTDRLAVQR